MQGPQVCADKTFRSADPSSLHSRPLGDIYLDLQKRLANNLGPRKVLGVWKKTKSFAINTVL